MFYMEDVIEGEVRLWLAAGEEIPSAWNRCQIL
jgi:hypothetical protein